ncbi:hypothetical protein JTE90_015778 [Oedothorax gibbosus]|uniref:Retinol dehydrogenase 11 n=1 Tax=Oedothorax gibbosus TaxID=931172 RepID=A0AAV6VXT7_9ARAC|nr:hypothetical protein JTE90_015778 [Oedothorax gibbosus]
MILLKVYVKLTCGVCRSTNSMEGKVIMVTGANSGIGFETAKDLARRKGRVIIACRDKTRGTNAAETIIRETGNPNVVMRQLDLSSLDSVQKFAADINATEERLDVLIHNAGAVLGTEWTKDNLEVQFATNHFGPFLLNHLLLDLMKKSAPSRIVVLSSAMHHLAPLVFDLDNLNSDKYTRHPMLVYSSTKFANLLWVQELAERLVGTGVTANALHPGVVHTNFAWNVWKDFFVFLLKASIYLFEKNAKEGAQTSIYLAVADEVRNVSGKYFSDCKPAWVSPSANEEKARKLWEMSEKLTGIAAV